LEQRVADLESQYKQRQTNFRQRVKDEVKNYLNELKNK
jgi:DNA-binding protein Fis